MTPEQMEERDVVEFVDDEGNTLLLEVMDYFFYNGEEFAALCDAKEEEDGEDSEDEPVYIMRSAFPSVPLPAERTLPFLRRSRRRSC